MWPFVHSLSSLLRSIMLNTLPEAEASKLGSSHGLTSGKLSGSMTDSNPSRGSVKSAVRDCGGESLWDCFEAGCGYLGFSSKLSIVLFPPGESSQQSSIPHTRSMLTFSIPSPQLKLGPRMARGPCSRLSVFPIPLRPTSLSIAHFSFLNHHPHLYP